MLPAWIYDPGPYLQAISRTLESKEKQEGSGDEAGNQAGHQSERDCFCKAFHNSPLVRSLSYQPAWQNEVHLAALLRKHFGRSATATALIGRPQTETFVELGRQCVQDEHRK